MKSIFSKLRGLIGLTTLIFMSSVSAESLTEFATRCETDLQIPLNSISGFNCSNGSVLPTTQFGQACDSEALLGGVGCIANSRLGIKSFTNANVKAVWVCRKYTAYDNANDDKYHDVAMIIHNRQNGKTCFFQNKLDNSSDGPSIPGPKEANAQDVWKTPAQTASINCTSCHNNDPFIVTPHVARALNANAMVRFNPKGDYSVVGTDFGHFNSQISRVEGCGGICHFNPKSSFSNDALSKGWMTPESIAGYTPYHFNPINGQFYEMRSNGQIWGFNGVDGGTCNGGSCPHWSVLDGNVATTKMAASGSKLYQLHNTGKIWMFDGVQCSTDSCSSWTLIDNNPKSVQIVSGNNKVYQRWTDGTIWQYTGTPCNGNNCLGWQKLDNNGATVQIVASGNFLYQRHSSGAIWKYTGTPCSANGCFGWQKLDNNSSTVDIIAGGTSLYQKHSSGAIWKYTDTPCSGNSCVGWVKIDNSNANTKQVAVGYSTVYRLHHNGEIWRYTGNGQNWEMLDHNAKTVEIAASSNGLLQRHNTGAVWRFTGALCSNGSCPGWTLIHNFANSMSLLGARL